MTSVAPGLHLLIDLWGCNHLHDMALVDATIRQAADICGATLLDMMLHRFGEDGGITGVAILAESHISIHTWPETGYIAIDVFMCGRCDPHLSVPVFEAAFAAKRMKVTEHPRGNQKDSL